MTRDMTSGSPLKLILLFAVPVFMGNLFHQFYNMVDAVIVGRFLGADALAAVGSVGTLGYLVHGLTNGFSQGLGIMVSHAFGAKDYRLLKHYVAVAVMITLIVSAFVTVPILPLCDTFLQWINIPENIFRLSYDYLFIIFAGTVFSMTYNVSAAVLRAIGDSKTPLYFLIISSVLNIFLDVFMIAVLKMGTAGAAYATVLSQAISALLCCCYMFRKFDILQPDKQDYYLDFGTIRKLLTIGIPMSVNYMVTATGMTVLQASVNVFGSDVMAAYTAASKVSILSMQLPISLGVAMSTYCGQNYGAKNYGRIFAGVRTALGLNFAIAALDAALCIFGGAFAVSMFIENPSAEIVAYAKEYLWITSWFYVPLGWIFIYRNSLQGLGKGFTPMLSSLLEFFARYLTIALFAARFGYTAICFADPATWTSTSLVLMLPYYLWAYKQKKEMKLGKQNLDALA